MTGTVPVGPAIGPEDATSVVDQSAPTPRAVPSPTRSAVTTPALRGTSTATPPIAEPVTTAAPGRRTGVTTAHLDVTPATTDRIGPPVTVHTARVPQHSPAETIGRAAPGVTTTPAGARRPAMDVLPIEAAEAAETTGPPPAGPTTTRTDASTALHAPAATTAAARGTVETARSVPVRTARSDGTTAPGAVIVPATRRADLTGRAETATTAAPTVQGPSGPATIADTAVRISTDRVTTDRGTIAAVTVAVDLNDRLAIGPVATVRPSTTVARIAAPRLRTVRAVTARIGRGAVRPTGARSRTAAAPAGDGRLVAAIVATVTAPAPSPRATTGTAAPGPGRTDRRAREIAAAPIVPAATAIEAIGVGTNGRRSTAVHADPTTRPVARTAWGTRSIVAPGPSVRPV